MEGDVAVSGRATKPKRVVEVSTSTKDGPWRDCDSPVLAKVKCVEMISEAARA
jgi:hypothetical protein